MISRPSSIISCCVDFSEKKRRRTNEEIFAHPRWHLFCLLIPVNTFLQKIGAWYEGGSTEFIVWAPLRKTVQLVLSDASVHPMEKDEAGYWKTTLSVGPGTRYGFRLDDDKTYPDPASLSQPEGVHALSAVIDRPASPWHDADWKGIPLSNKIIYELHTGVFSDSHDFEGVTRRLDYLLELGVNTIELMPLGQFPGE